jgi:hypothetical protein
MCALSMHGAKPPSRCRTYGHAKTLWNICRSADDTGLGLKPMGACGIRPVCPMARVLKNAGCNKNRGDRNENGIQSFGCGAHAIRLYQQQQSAPGENDRRRAAELHHHGGLSGRNETALLACSQACVRQPSRAGIRGPVLGQLAGGWFGLGAFEPPHPRPDLAREDHAGCANRQSGSAQRLRNPSVASTQR